MTVTTLPLTGTWHADPDHSLLQFGVAHMKVGLFKADFADFAATVSADEHGIRFSGAAEVESVSIKNTDFRAHVVHGADFFDAGNHPQIQFTSTRVDLAADGSVGVTGELTIRGLTRPFTATGTVSGPVEDPFGGVRVAVELTAAVDRRDWGMTYQSVLPKGGLALGHEVTLTVQAEFVAAS